MNLPALALLTPHLAQSDSKQTPSHRIWSHLGVQNQPDGDNGWIYFGDDFLGYNALAASGAFGAAPYYGFLDTDCAIASVATQLGGVVRLTTSTTADAAAGFGPGQVAGMAKVGVGTPGTLTSKGGKVLFEARIALPSVEDAKGSFFIGLGELGLIADNGLFTDAHAVAGNDLIGFWVTDADGDKLNFGYNVGSGTAQVIGYTALAAATFVKVGFVYDPDCAPAKRIKWYVNGVEQSTYVTQANVAAATFPGGIQLSPAIYAKTDDNAAYSADLDWWHIGMQRLG